MASNLFGGLLGGAKPDGIDWSDRAEIDRLYNSICKTGIAPVISAVAANIDSSESPYKNSAQLINAIHSRMRGPVGFQHLTPVYVRERDMVVLFIIHKGDSITLEDEWAMFPSDALITKLRLLLG